MNSSLRCWIGAGNRFGVAKVPKLRALQRAQFRLRAPKKSERARTKAILLFFLGLYRMIGTSFFGGSCRFHPSCSEYAVEAVHVHPPMKAIRLIAKRLVKCRPGGAYGDDPVPRP